MAFFTAAAAAGRRRSPPPRENRENMQIAAPSLAPMTLLRGEAKHRVGGAKAAAAKGARGVKSTAGRKGPSAGKKRAVAKTKHSSRLLPRLGGLTAEMRDRALGEPQGPPRAVRVAPARSAFQYICDRVKDVSAVRKFLDAPENADRLDAEKRGLVEQVRKREDKRSWRGIERRIHETLRGTADKRYSIEKCVERIVSRVRVYSFEELAACEHLGVACPGAFWQIRVIIVLIMIIDDCDGAVLADCSTADDRCAFCLKSMTEVGAMNAQLEPCRHWLCNECARLALLQYGISQCGLCRREVRCAIPTRVA